MPPAATAMSLFMWQTESRHIGPARQQDGDYSYLADILQTVLPDVAWHNNIRAELWRKLAVNCVINPLTAIWNCPNGELRHHPQEIMQICEEVAAVIEREGHAYFSRRFA